jgi:hypothetical protein
LAETYGYRLWGELGGVKDQDLAKRVRFLHEYTRRIETTNLVVAEQFFKKLVRRGDKWSPKQFDFRFYRRALQKFMIYKDSDKLISSDREVLNSTKKPFLEEDTWNSINTV